MTAKPVPFFRPVSISDAQMLSEVAIRAYSDHYLHLWHDTGGWYIARSFTPDVLRGELNDTDSRFYFIYMEEEPIGFLKLNIHRPSPCNTALNAMELERIYLQKKATGRGVGEAAMHFVVEQARQLKKQLVWLKAMDSSYEAISFYQKRGFAICGTDRLTFDLMKEEFRGMIVCQRFM